MILRKNPPKVPELKDFSPKAPPPPQGYIPNGYSGDTKLRRWAIEQSILLKNSKSDPASIIEMAEAIIAFVKDESR